MKNFAITGVAGYVAPRHLKAIKDTGNRLIAAVDPYDSVGILDQYFSDVSFFTEFERFDRHVEKLRRGAEEDRIQYLTICSPNYLHDAHIRFALRIGAHAICEKPLVVKPWNLDALEELEQETGGRLSTILQLRVHPAVIELKKRLEQSESRSRHEILLTYVTSRGPWYQYSWKGSLDKSGGIATNIGIHFFDLLLWLFGKAESSIVHVSDTTRMAGFLELERANVRWFLSINRDDLPAEALSEGKSTYRSITIDGQEIDLSQGFTDLHTRIYEEILAGGDFGIGVARPSLKLVYGIQNAGVSRENEQRHPFVSVSHQGRLSHALLQT